MLIIGAKGLAKELLEVIYQNVTVNNIAFYDDVNEEIGDSLYKTFPIIKNEGEVEAYFNSQGNSFVLGLGNPILRNKLFEKFTKLGGVLNSAICKNSRLGSFDVQIGVGTIILSGVNISNSVKIGKGSIVYYNANITHDCVIGDFVEISPSVNLLGNVNVGSFTQIGANSTILPKLTIGKNVIIGAGSVVTKNIPDNTMVLGIPAKIVKHIEPLNF
jgi:sugar O-acyltransferase (sialic acid O-acetyltransferase NeuD family)